VPVEVVVRDEVLQRHRRQRGERPRLRPHHGGLLRGLARDNRRDGIMAPDEAFFNLLEGF
jgi:hypothetical protein